jgi:ATP-binding cassette subfamily C protein
MLPEVARHWTRQQNKLLARSAAVTRLSTKFSVAAKTSRQAMQAGVVAVGAILVVHHEASPGSLLGATLLMGRLLLPFEQLITAWRHWTAAMATWCRVRDLLAGASSRPRRPAPATVEGRLVLDGVSFAPVSVSAPIVNEVSLTIEPGEAVAIVGPSGSGKSTLARLIMGILIPTAGRVTLDGVPTSDWDRGELAKHVGYLAQSVGLLDGTILDNIARMDSAETTFAIEAANRAGVHDLIGRLPDGYATQVGDAGQALSGGARQRIALARALYGQPKLLVLDEPNANLDHDGEQALVKVIREVKASGAAVLLITHRPSILAAVDRVVAFEAGRIARIENATPRPSLGTAGRTGQAAGVR